jgi:hypothetical protein
MTEIRTIRHEECEEYLSVLCESFALDLARARTAFFGEPYFSLDRKWSLIVDRSIVSILTVVPIEFGDGKGVGIAGVATRDTERGSGHASDLLNYVCDYYAAHDAPKALLFAKEQSLYERVGFSLADCVYVQPLAAGRAAHRQPIDKEKVKLIYDDWSQGDPRRLRRDEARWAYWSWTLRTPVALDGGYFCYESARLRELLPSYSRLPISEPIDFYGTAAIAEAIGITLDKPTVDLYLMAKGFGYVPQMFMTDQF